MRIFEVEGSVRVYRDKDQELVILVQRGNRVRFLGEDKPIEPVPLSEPSDYKTKMWPLP